MKKLIDENNELFQELDFEKNQDVECSELSATSSTKVWWRCKENDKHRWKQAVRVRNIQGYGCPYCSGKMTLPEESFAANFPKLFAEWDYEKNKNLDPFSYSNNSNKNVWWKCTNRHSWRATIHHRVVYKNGCRECNNLKFKIPNRCPELLDEWHPEKNLPLTPDQISCGSKEKVWWKCRKNPKHIWQRRVLSRSRDDSGCPFCRQKKAIPNSYPPLGQYLPELSKEWHPIKNNGLTPFDFTAGSSRKAWWQCSSNPDHEWEAAIGGRALKGRGCPYCSRQKVSAENSLANKSPEIAKQWHPSKNGSLTPKTVSYGSAKRVWWLCDLNPRHEWEATVTSRRNNGCPLCTGHKVESENSLAKIYPEISKEWHSTKNSPLTPGDVTKASGRKVWWQCSKSPDHEWLAQIKNRTVLGSGCPICAREWGTYRVQNALIESAYLNTDYFKTFILNINNLRKLVELPVDEKRLSQPFFRMIYSSTITCLETYLSDAFYHLTISTPELVHKILMTDPEFSERKYSVKELIAWQKDGIKQVESYLFSIVWHNLAKTQKLYKHVLEIEFPDEMEAIYRAISIRHDLVHRNGKTKSGSFHRLHKNQLLELFDDTHKFVSFLDSQAGSIQTKKQS